MATRFRFRLQPLLKVRKSLEEEAQRQLARALAARQEAHAQLEAHQQSHADTVESRRTAPGAALDILQWKAAERFLVVLERRIAEAHVAVHTADQKVLEARHALMKAHQAHLTLLRLKERRQEQHAFEQLQDELRTMDELAVLRYRFNTRG